MNTSLQFWLALGVALAFGLIAVWQTWRLHQVRASLANEKHFSQMIVLMNDISHKGMTRLFREERQKFDLLRGVDLKRDALWRVEQ